VGNVWRGFWQETARQRPIIGGHTLYFRFQTFVLDKSDSESQFRTLKYRPKFPDRFGCIQDSRAFCQQCFLWYNQEHRHSGIGLLTPAMVHFGEAHSVLERRQRVLDAAYQAPPDRFVRRPPRPLPLPSEVWINKPIPAGQTSKKGSQ
jgi:putative transposase